jgi:hypothetical protein
LQKPEKNRTNLGMNRWFVPAIRSGIAIDPMLITFGEVFAMQPWGLSCGAILRLPFCASKIYYAINAPDSGDGR